MNMAECRIIPSEKQSAPAMKTHRLRRSRTNRSFESECYATFRNNDLLHKQGAIHPDCIARAARQLEHWRYRGRLRLAVWHHSVNGSPEQSDYLDARSVKKLELSRLPIADRLLAYRKREAFQREGPRPRGW